MILYRELRDDAAVYALAQKLRLYAFLIGDENMMKSAKLLIMSAVLVLFAACDNKNGGSTEPPVTKTIETLLDILDAANGKPLQEVTPGRPVRLVLELKNLTDKPLTLNFSTGKQYDFEVHDSNNQLIWAWSRGKVFIQAATKIILGPKEQIKFTPDWDQRDNEGRQVVAGTYQVTGLIPTTGPEIVESQTKSLVIKE